MTQCQIENHIFGNIPFLEVRNVTRKLLGNVNC